MGKRPDETIVLFYRSDFQEYLTDNPSTLVCLSESTRQIILSLLRFACWPTRWRIDSEDNSRRVTGDIWEEVQQWGELAQKEVLFDMSCDINESLDQVNTTLEGISGWLEQLTGITALIEQVTSIITELGDLAALATIAVNTGNINTTLGNLQLDPTTNVNVTNNHPITVSGGGSCSPNCAPGGGSFTPPDAAPGQSTPGGGPGGYEPPAGWGGTTEEYNAYKCKAATFLVDSYLTYVAKFSLFASLGLSAITVSMFFALMPDKFMALISPVLAFALFAYLLTVALAGDVLGGYLGLYHANLSSVRDDTICELYNAPTVADARQVISDWMTEQLPAGLGSVPGFVDYHVSSLFTNEVLNILFVEYDALSDEPDGDCSGCGPEMGLFRIIEENGHPYGENVVVHDNGNVNGNDITSGDFSVDSYYISGSNLHIIWLRVNPGEADCWLISIEGTNYTPYDFNTFCAAVTVCGVGDVIYNTGNFNWNSFEQVNEAGDGQIRFHSSTAFTLRVTRL